MGPEMRCLRFEEVGEAGFAAAPSPRQELQQQLCSRRPLSRPVPCRDEEGKSSGARKFTGGPSGSLRVSCLGGRSSLGRAGRAFGRKLRTAAADRTEPGSDDAGAQDEHEAVGTSLKGVPDSLSGRTEEAGSGRAAVGSAADPRTLSSTPWGSSAMALPPASTTSPVSHTDPPPPLALTSLVVDAALGGAQSTGGSDAGSKGLGVQSYVRAARPALASAPPGSHRASGRSARCSRPGGK